MRSETSQMMWKSWRCWALLAACLMLLYMAGTRFPPGVEAGVTPAIIPGAVPTANKRGNSAVFQLGAASAPNIGECAQYDANLNLGGVTCVGTPGSTLFSSTTSTGPSNTASETTLIGTVTGSTTIAANTFTDGAVLEARAQGYFSLPATADALTLKAKCGSTVLGSASFTPPAGALTNGTFRFWLLITARGTGASGAFMTNGVVELTGSALTPSISKVLNTSNVSFDFTTACAFDLTAQWGAAQVGEEILGSNCAAWFPGAPVTSVNGSTGAVTVAAITANNKVRSFGGTFDGGGSALTAGKTLYYTIPFACAISAWNIVVDTGTATIDIWRVATGTAIPTVANTITASAVPAISSGTAVHSTTMTGWCGTGTCSIVANDIIGINLKVVATATYANLVVECDQ